MRCSSGMISSRMTLRIWSRRTSSSSGSRKPGKFIPAGSNPHGAIGRCPPLREPLVDAPHDVHVGPQQAGGDRPDLAVAQREPVDGDDRRDLEAAAAQERLVGHVELRAIDLAELYVADEAFL